MTSALLTRPPTLFDELAVPEAHSGGVGGEPTLDALIIGVWEGLAAHQPVSCPVCTAELEPVYAADARPAVATPQASSVRPPVVIAGRCRGCGTTLS